MEDLWSLLPTTETPGFKLASPRAFQVLLALLDHARRFGVMPSEPAAAKSKPMADDQGTKPKPKRPKRPSLAAVAKSPGLATSNETAAPASKPKPKKKRRQTKATRAAKSRMQCADIPQTTGVEAEWTVDQLAGVCGCNRNTAGATLKELVALGWIRKNIGRHLGGEYCGFRYRLLVPPSTLTSTAHHHYKSKADEAEVRLREKQQRIEESAGSDSIELSGKPPTAFEF